jgi:hypothetical protein
MCNEMEYQAVISPPRNTRDVDVQRKRVKRVDWPVIATPLNADVQRKQGQGLSLAGERLNG